MTTKCPNCGSKADVRLAIYGMPSSEADQTKYYVAGCIDDGQKYVCTACKWGIEEDPVSFIDTAFDVRTDANGKDPDKNSLTLKRYHKLLWSKPLPTGEFFNLVLGKSGSYLHFKSTFYEVSLSSDSIGHSYGDVKKMSKVLEGIPLADVESFKSLNSTVGGFIIFPGKKVDGKKTINQERGTNYLIADRFDLTLECIRLHYEKQASPLSQVLERYGDFFQLFETFSGYVDFFLLNDLVDSEYKKISFYTEIDEPFISKPLPSSRDEYLKYRRNVMTFITKRNLRISGWVNSVTPALQPVKSSNEWSDEKGLGLGF